MNVQFACGKCGKQLAVRPELAGKRVKCPQCGAAVQVPGAAQPAAAPAAQAVPGPMPGAMPAAAMPQAPGLGSLADLLDDSGPGKLVEAPQLQYGQTLCPGCQQPIQIGAAVCVKCGLDLRGGRSLETRTKKPPTPGQQKFVQALVALGWVLLAHVVFAVLFGAALGVWFGFNLVERELPYRQVAITLMVLGGGFAVLHYFSIAADAFQEGWGPGLMILFVPGYWIFYIITRWAKCRRSFIHWMVANWFGWLGFIMMMSVWASEAAHPQPQPRAAQADPAPVAAVLRP